MITSLKPIFDLSVEMVGYTSEKIGTPKIGDIVKIYVPQIMPLIKGRGTAIDSSEALSRTNLFCNDSSCKPKVKSLLKTQNYLKMTSDTVTEGWNGIDIISRNSKGYIVNRTLPLETKVLCEFINATFEQCNFTSSGYPGQRTPGTERAHDDYIYTADQLYDMLDRIGAFNPKESTN